MRVSYKKLWKLLVDLDMSKSDLRKATGLATGTMTKLRRDEDISMDAIKRMLMYGKEASNRKQEIDRQHYTIPNQRPKDKHCGKI